MKLWAWEIDCGRMGMLGGAFFATDEQIEKMKGKSVWMSDVLGKHSEIEFEISDDLLTAVELSEESTQTLIDKFGTVLLGEDLIAYVEESEEWYDEEEDEDEDDDDG